MKFRLIDAVLERDATRAVAVKNVTSAEEYLADHFPGFPVLPGVFMVESMVQAAREVLDVRATAAGQPPRRYVLGQVRALRYGSFVRPGEALRVEVTLDKEQPDGSVTFRGQGTVLRRDAEGRPGSSETAVSGRFTMRLLLPSSIARPAVGAAAGA
jgi:3-hydroxyacyl-[acyl-carrier-protein] dehydratase